ncbi:hypothetical protein WJX81_004207 [Elliptochloris bilobata]|uniref:Bromo domain-containing protein n=1 Tax=Elliptochloris bilobata TaxID=381761 RepID=A0AAW1S4X5_9CHLO
MEGNVEVDPAELHLLILLSLAEGPCREAASLLEREAARHGLLPVRTDFLGRQHALGYEALWERYRGLPRDALARLLARGGALRPGGSLLAPGVVPGGPPPSAPPPAWLRAPHTGANMLRVARLREVGWAKAVQNPRVLAPPALVARALAHQRTARGHRAAVYCIAFDRVGRRVMTGSDDRLVKFWSVDTMLLLTTCRGHTGEITDVVMSWDGAVAASSSNDCTIRCWDLQDGRLGWPVSVLLGHTAPVTFVDFCRVVPDALLSSSFDGTCRIWDARAGGAALHVLRAAPVFAPDFNPDPSPDAPSAAPREGPGPGRRGSAGAPGPSRGGAAVSTGSGLGSGSPWAAGVPPWGDPAAARPATVADGEGAAGVNATAGPSGQQARADASVNDGTADGASGAAADLPAIGGGGGGDVRAANEEYAGNAGPAGANEPGAPANEPDEPGMLVCAFSPDGAHIVAGAGDCHVYVWGWNLPPAAHPSPNPATSARAHPGASAALRHAPASASEAPLLVTECSPPAPLVRLGGHRHDVLLLLFSHDGAGFATGSKDGTVRVWRQAQQRARPRSAAAKPCAEPLLGSWGVAWVAACPPVQDADAATARRRRRAPPEPSISQVAWTTDDAHVLAAVTDGRVLVLDAASGSLRHCLAEHRLEVPIIEGHPSDARMAMTAGYDGNVIVWDIVAGRKLASFYTVDTRPDGRAWPEPVQLVDGHWAPDGTSLAVADVAGQWHLYSASGGGNDEKNPSPGPKMGALTLRRRPAWAAQPGRGALASNARYDQFFASDYGALTRDAAGFVLDAETQLPPHIRSERERLVDLLNDAYPEAYQTAFREGRVGRLCLADAVAEGDGPPPLTGTLPHALAIHPPLATAAGWHTQENGGDEVDIQRAYQTAMHRWQAVLHEEALAAALPSPASLSRARATRTTDAGDEMGIAADDAQPVQAAARLAAAQEGAAAERTGVADAARPLTRAERAARRQDGLSDEPLYFMATSSESPSSEGGSRFESDWESAEGGDDDGDLAFGEEEAPLRPVRSLGDGRRRLRSQRGRPEADAEEGGIRTRRGAAQRAAAAAAAAAAADPDATAGAGPSREPEGDAAAPEPRQHQNRRRERGRRRPRGGADEEEGGGAGPSEGGASPSRGTGGSQVRARKRPRPNYAEPANDEAELEATELSEEAEEDNAADDGDLYEAEEEPEGEEDDDDENEDASASDELDAEGIRSRVPGTRGQPRRHAAVTLPALRPRRDRRDCTLTLRSARGGGSSVERAQRTSQRGARLLAQAAPSAGLGSGSGRSGRPATAYAWLQASEHTPGMYAPQVGDEVVYLPEGHRICLHNTRDKRPGPWDTVTAPGPRGRMRPAEPARVEGLRYAITDDGRRDTVAVLQLVLSGEDLEHRARTPLAGRRFELELSSPRNGQAEFVVLRTRFQAALCARWRTGDRCQLHFGEEDGGGRWWLGTVAEDRDLEDSAPADDVGGVEVPVSQNGDPQSAWAAIDWGCGGLWERYSVAWDASDLDPNTGRDSDGGGAAVIEATQQSPWEMFAPGTTAEVARAEAPVLADEVAARALGTVEALMVAPRFCLFVDTPAPGDRYPADHAGRVMVWYTAQVALPLALRNLRDRLLAGYYRQPQALAHDAATIAANAVAFNGADSAEAARAHELAEAVESAAEGQWPPEALAGAVRRQRTQRGRRHAAADEDEGFSDSSGGSAGDGRRRGGHRASRRAERAGNGHVGHTQDGARDRPGLAGSGHAAQAACGAAPEDAPDAGQGLGRLRLRIPLRMRRNDEASATVRPRRAAAQRRGRYGEGGSGSESTDPDDLLPERS